MHCASSIRQRLNRLGGWHRLFVVLLLLWSVIVLPESFEQVVHSQYVYKSDLIPGPPCTNEGVALWRQCFRQSLTLGSDLSCGSCLDKTAPYKHFVFDFQALVRATAEAGEWWLLPPVIVYGVAQLIGWVVKGFRKG